MALDYFKTENRDTYKQLKANFPDLKTRLDSYINDGFILKKLGNSFCIYTTIYEDRPHRLIFVITPQYVKASELWTEYEQLRFRASKIFSIPI